MEENCTHLARSTTTHRSRGHPNHKEAMEAVVAQWNETQCAERDALANASHADVAGIQTQSNWITDEVGRGRPLRRLLHTTPEAAIDPTSTYAQTAPTTTRLLITNTDYS